MMIACACGCGQLIADRDDRNRLRRYVRGHHHRGKSNTWLKKPDDDVQQSSRHESARRIKQDVTRCEWSHIGYCKGMLDVAHIDGNWTNNDPGNLIKLCRSHHRLLDHGRIDPHNPQMPAFTVSSGKRRYKG